MENKKQLRIKNQLKKVLEKCPNSELTICTAYYVPNEQEVDNYLKQGDYSTQLNNLLSGNNPLVERMLSPTKQQEFSNLVNNSLTYGIGLETGFDETTITNMILDLLLPVFQDRGSLKKIIEQRKIISDIKKRVKNSVERKIDIVTGIEQILQIKFEKTLGLSKNQYNQISGEINKLAKDIRKKLIDDGFLMIKIDLSSKREELKNIVNGMINDPNYLSTVTPIPKEKQIPKEIIIQRIINSIMYKSASDAFKIEVNKPEGYIRINGEIIPITIYEEILDILENNVEKTFRNINMYLTNSDTIFTDQFNRKYILHLDDTHILGIEQTTNFLRAIVAKKTYENNQEKYKRLNYTVEQHGNYSKLTQGEIDFYLTCQKYLKNKKFCQNIEEKIKIVSSQTIPKVDQPSLKKGTKIIFGPNIEKFSTIFTIYNHLYRLSDKVPENEEQINLQIENVNIIQGKINEIISDQRESKVFERLIYFLIKDSYNPMEVLNNITEEQINDAFEKNMCLFSNEYYMKFKENPSNLVKRISTLTKEKIDKIKDKYGEIFEIQNYLDYKYKVISQSIINNIPYEKWEKYFSGKHDNENGKLRTDRIGPFGIAQLLLENEIQEHKSLLKTGTNIENAIFNLFKVDDKTYYIINFNFITDVNRIFIVNNKNNENEHHVICEMEAFDETLVAYFEEVNENGVARFYSVQNTEEVLMSSFTESHLSRVIDFKGKEYSTILVFSESSEDQRITQHYTSAREKLVSIPIFVKCLLDEKIELRTATSLNVAGDYNQDSKKYILDLLQKILNHKKTISKSEMNELNMVGYSNADYMIDHLTSEEATSFLGLESITSIELALVIAVLKLKNLKNLTEALIVTLEEKKKNLSEYKKNNGSKDNNSIGNLMQERVKKLIEEINYLEQLINSNLDCIKISEEVLKQKDSSNNPIPLNTSEDIKKYFEKNMHIFKIGHGPILKYLAESSLALGDEELFRQITFHYIFIEHVEKSKQQFEKKQGEYYKLYENIASADDKTYDFISMVQTSKKNPKSNSVNWIENEISRVKAEFLAHLSDELKAHDTIKPQNYKSYLELAEKELCSTIQFDNLTAKKTKFEQAVEERCLLIQAELEETILQDREQLRKRINEDITSNDYNSETIYNLINSISSKIRSANDGLFKQRDSYKYRLNVADLIDEYHFQEQASKLKLQYYKRTNIIFDTMYENSCSIGSIFDFLFSILEERIQNTDEASQNTLLYYAKIIYGLTEKFIDENIYLSENNKDDYKHLIKEKLIAFNLKVQSKLNIKLDPYIFPLKTEEPDYDKNKQKSEDLRMKDDVLGALSIH